MLAVTRLDCVEQQVAGALLDGQVSSFLERIIAGFRPIPGTDDRADLLRISVLGERRRVA